MHGQFNNIKANIMITTSEQNVFYVFHVLLFYLHELFYSACTQKRYVYTSVYQICYMYIIIIQMKRKQ